MPDKFGSPDAHDIVAQDEKTVQEAAQYAVDLDRAMKTMYPRDLGSQKVSSQDMAREYDIARATADAGDPRHLAQLIGDNAHTLEEMIQFAKAQEKRRG